MLKFLLHWEPLWRMADALYAWQPGNPGRPPDHPAIVILIFGIMRWHLGSLRKADIEFAQREVWSLVIEALQAHFPDYPGMTGARPVDRFNYARFRDAHGLADADFERFRDVVTVEAARQAQAMGMMLEENNGSLTRVDPLNIICGDGTVVRPLWGRVAGEVQLDETTGELVAVRSDPDVEWHLRRKNEDGEDGPGEGVAEALAADDKEKKRHTPGINWVITHANSEHEDERIVFSMRPAQHRDGGEAKVAVEDIKRLKASVLPGIEGVNWDKALRGSHLETLYAIGIQPAGIRVARVKGGKAKYVRVETLDVRRDGRVVGQIELIANNGAPGFEAPAGGEMHWVKLERIQTRCETNRKHGRRWYQRCRIPDEALVPSHLRGASVLVRLNGRTQGGKVNRAEVLRPWSEDDPEEWQILFRGRPCSESLNCWLKDRLSKRRLPSIGIPRQRFDLTGAQIYNNVRAMIAHRRRLGLPDYGPLPPPDVRAA